MSLVIFFIYWAVIPLFLYWTIRLLWKRARTPLSRGMVMVMSVFVVLGLLWLAVGEKLWLDYQVRELCAKDGGVKVYETVKLPAEKFDKYGNVRIPAKQDAKPSDAYYSEWNVHRYRDGNPSMRRDHFLIIRRSDGKLLGEDVSYARRGGDMPGPWHDSSFRCPDPTRQPSLESSIFLKGDVK